MKLFSFFSKVTFICNLSFLLFVLFSKMEVKQTIGNTSGITAIPFFKNIIIILGVSAIIINLIMCIAYLIALLSQKYFLIPKWLAAVNFAFFLMQLYFFFLH